MREATAQSKPQSGFWLTLELSRRRIRFGMRQYADRHVERLTARMESELKQLFADVDGLSNHLDMAARLVAVALMTQTRELHLLRGRRNAVLGLRDLYKWARSYERTPSQWNAEVAGLGPQESWVLLPPILLYLDEWDRMGGGIPWLRWESFIQTVADQCLQSGSEDASGYRYRVFLRRIGQDGILRPLPFLPAPALFDELARDFPNFASVTEVYRDEAALFRAGSAARPAFTPVLLVGAPGIGKTAFANRLAGLFATRAILVQLSSASQGWSLSGLSRVWSNGHAGELFRALARGPAINPVVVLDEIDKVRASFQSDPMGALYPLLEPHTARAFIDEYSGFAVDASLVIWLATANEYMAVPEAIRSRFHVARITPPTVEQMTEIIQSQYGALLTHYGISERAPALPTALIKALSRYRPRETQRLLKRWLALVVMECVPDADQAAQIELLLRSCRPDLENHARIGFIGP